MTMTKFRKWESINQFHEVTKNLNYPKIWETLKGLDHKLEYGLKIKLHGSNACVRIESDGKVVPQKRSSDIGLMKDGSWRDNFGFAQWVLDNESYFARLAKSDSDVYIYGEWCGPGVQDSVAVSKTDKKFFYIFSVDISSNCETTRNFIEKRIYCPNLIEEFLTTKCINDIIVVPFHKEITIDLLNKSETQKQLFTLNKEVEAIGDKDPFIFELFDIEGCGEGLVAYPKIGTELGIYKDEEKIYFSWFNFKAKSEAHRVNKTKAATAFDAEKFASVQHFADQFATENRFLQGFNEALSCQQDLRLIPTFIKWVCQDIWKESAAEREASPELDWKLCSKAISTRAVSWYKKKVLETV